MINKRGQITIFIVIAIVVVVAIIGYFLLKGSSIETRVNPEVQPVYDYMAECFQESLGESVVIIGIQGGYITIPEDYITTDISDIAYGYYLGSKTLPSKKVIEEEIGYYLEKKASTCADTADISGFEIQGKGGAVADVDISEEEIYATITYPLTINKGSSIYTLGSFSTDISVNLGKIYIVADEIVNKEIEDPENINLDYLKEQRYDIDVAMYSEDTIIYSITDSDSKINNISYMFRFANKLQ